MKRELYLLNFVVLIALAISPGCVTELRTGEQFSIKNGDNVVFYGDSITDGQLYPILIEIWVVTRHPGWRNRFSNRGVSGDSSKSISRFERDVIAQKPDLVLFNMGFNDGGYGLFDAGRLKSYLDNVEISWNKLHQALPATRMILVSPIPSEPKVSRDIRWITRDGYPYTMLMFGRVEKRLAKRLGLPFIDLGSNYGRTVGLGEVVAGDAFSLSRDGVHPQEEGQTYLACHLLEGLNAKPELASVELDARGTKTVKTARCKVSNFKVNEDGSLSFSRTCESLPFPVPAVARPFRFLVNLDDRFNRDMIRIEGLTAPAYKLLIDDKEIVKLPAAAFQDGVNLGAYDSTPMYTQALNVLDAVRKYAGAKSYFWGKWIRSSNRADGAGKPLPETTDAEAKEMAADMANIGNLRTIVYSGNKPETHEFKLVPLEEEIPLFSDISGASVNQAWLKVRAKPVRVNWNTGEFIEKKTEITVSDPGQYPRDYMISWDTDKMSPQSSNGHVEPGKKSAQDFSILAKSASEPPPSYTLRWHWDKNWAYPMKIRRPLEYLPVLTINKSTTPVKLDGNLDDWKDATTFVLDRISMVNPSITGKRNLWDGPEDLSGKVFMKWSELGLCLAVDVSDNEHLQEKSAHMMWSQDMLHLAFCDRQKGRKTGFYEFGFGVRSNNDVETVKYRSSVKGEIKPEIGVKGKLTRNGKGCVYEVVIPWGHLVPIEPKEGNEFRFTMSINDADNQPGKGFNYIQWSYGINYGKNPNDFGYIILGPAKK